MVNMRATATVSKRVEMPQKGGIWGYVWCNREEAFQSVGKSLQE